MAEKRYWLDCKQTHSHNYFDEDGNPYGGTSYGVGFTISWQRGALGRDEEEPRKGTATAPSWRM